MAKSYEVVVTARAESDHQNILSYLAENVGYQTSENINLAIIRNIKNLRERPEKNGLFKPKLFQSKLFRRIIIKNAWNLIFQIDEIEQVVYIHRILHVKRGDNFIKKALK